VRRHTPLFDYVQGKYATVIGDSGLFSAKQGNSCGGNRLVVLIEDPAADRFGLAHAKEGAEHGQDTDGWFHCSIFFS
jgi:hypothetical protein